MQFFRCATVGVYLYLHVCRSQLWFQCIVFSQEERMCLEPEGGQNKILNKANIVKIQPFLQATYQYLFVHHSYLFIGLVYSILYILMFVSCYNNHEYTYNIVVVFSFHVLLESCSCIYYETLVVASMLIDILLSVYTSSSIPHSIRFLLSQLTVFQRESDEKLKIDCEAS